MATFVDEGLFLDLNGASDSHNIFLLSLQQLKIAMGRYHILTRGENWV